MNKDIREKKRRLADQKIIENQAKEKLDNLLRLKPKDYKNVSKKEKEEIKNNYEYEKIKKMFYEKEIQKLEKMLPLEYSSILTSDIKEKLIGLCLDKKIMDGFNEDGETMYEEEEIEEEVEEDEDFANE